MHQSCRSDWYIYKKHSRLHWWFDPSTTSWSGWDSHILSSRVHRFSDKPSDTEPAKVWSSAQPSFVDHTIVQFKAPWSWWPHLTATNLKALYYWSKLLEGSGGPPFPGECLNLGMSSPGEALGPSSTEGATHKRLPKIEAVSRGWQACSSCGWRRIRRRSLLCCGCQGSNNSATRFTGKTWKSTNGFSRCRLDAQIYGGIWRHRQTVWIIRCSASTR